MHADARMAKMMIMMGVGVPLRVTKNCRDVDSQMVCQYGRPKLRADLVATLSNMKTRDRSNDSFL